MESLTMPYCQITKGKVSAKTCAETQGQDECFGCAAETRKCEYCKEVMVEIPAVGLCNVCIKLLMESEMEKEPRQDSLPEKLACIKCHINPIRFREYKMCLRCSVEEYGRDLSAEDLKNNPIKDDKPGKRVLSFSKKTTKKAISLLPEARKLVIKSGNASANFIFKNLKGISYVTAEKLLQLLEEEGMIAPSSSRYGRRKVIASFSSGNIAIKKQKRRISDEVKQKAIALLPKAKELILEHRNASHKILRSHLKIGHNVANLILAKLEAEKFIGPYYGKRESRAILAQTPAIKQPNIVKEFSLDQKTDRMKSLINIIGNCELTEIMTAIVRDLIAFDEIKKVINK